MRQHNRVRRGGCFFFKKTVTFLLVAVFLFIPALCLSAYRIHLKGERKLITGQYWEKGDQIHFKLFGGQVGIPREQVITIEEVPFELENTKKKGKTKNSEKTRPKSNTEEVSPKKISETKVPKAEAVDNPVTDKKKPPENLSDLEPYRQSYLELKIQYQQARQAYWKARRAKNTAAKEKALNEMESAEMWLKDLKEKVKAINHGVPPKWWR